MATPMVQIETGEVARVRKTLARLREAGADTRIPLKRFNVYMLGQTDKTFERGGRGDVKWKKLAPATVAMRKWAADNLGGKRSNPEKILQEKRTLQGHIKYTVAKRRGVPAAIMYSPTPYAPTHQFGGTLKRKARTIRAKPGRYLRFVINGQVFYRKSVKQPARNFKVPKRQFLFYTDNDEAKFNDILIKFEHELAGRIVK